jgi:hypothetical protein
MSCTLKRMNKTTVNPFLQDHGLKILFWVQDY